MTQKIAGISLIVAGVAGFLIFLLTSIFSFLGAIRRVDVPGSQDVALKAGPHTVYWEILSGFRKPGGKPDDLRLSVSLDGTELPLREVSPMKSTYSSGSRKGVSIYAVDVPSPGACRVSASGTPPGQGSVAIGPAMGVGRILLTVFGCMAFMGVGLGAGIPLLLRSMKRA